MALLLAIEPSCDKTAVAIVRGLPGRATEVLASEISSQIALHREHIGVVPEPASRKHSLKSKTRLRFATMTRPLLLPSLPELVSRSGAPMASQRPFRARLLPKPSNVCPADTVGRSNVIFAKCPHQRHERTVNPLRECGT